jgi:hypothetical protein
MYSSFPPAFKVCDFENPISVSSSPTSSDQVHHFSVCITYAFI